MDKPIPIEELKRRLAEAKTDAVRLAALIEFRKWRSELPYDEISAYLREAVVLARKTENHGDLAKAGVVLCELCRDAGEMAASIEWAGVVREAATRSGNPSNEGRYLYLLGRVHEVQWECERARECYELCLDVWRKCGYARGVGAALNQLGNLALLQGKATEALEHYRDCLNVDDELGDIENGAVHQHNIGLLFQQLGHLDDAFECFRRVFALSERHQQLRSLRAGALNSLGEVFLERDRTDKAIDLFRMAVDGMERTKARPETLHEATANIGLAYHRQGNLASAREAYEQALTMAEKSGDRHGAAIVLWRMADLALDMGQSEHCRELAERSLTAARENRLVCEEAEALRVMALSHVARGEDPEARACFEQAMALLCNHGESLILARVRFHYGRHLLALAEREAAMTNLRAASRVFRGLGAVADWHEVSRLLLDQEMEHDREMALLQVVSGLSSSGAEPRAVLDRAVGLLLGVLKFDSAVVVALGRPVLVLGDPSLGRALGFEQSQEFVADDKVLSWPVRCGGRCLGRIYLERAVPMASGQNQRVLDTIANLLVVPIRRLVEATAGAVEERPQLAGLRYRGVVGPSQRMLEVLTSVCAIAARTDPVLIRGEAGTGKKLVARAIHDSGTRAGRPLVVVNCAGASEALLVAEIFGVANGNATGVRGRRGKLESADGGTLLLDEVCALSPALQVRVLRLLEEKTFERVGGNVPASVDVRIVATTDRPVAELVAQGRFREDLCNRLKAVELLLPALTERREDVPDLACHFVLRCSEELGLGTTCLSSEAMSRLASHRWPGNILELEHVVNRAVLLASGKTIQVSDLPPGLQSSAS